MICCSYHMRYKSSIGDGHHCELGLDIELFKSDRIVFFSVSHKLPRTAFSEWSIEITIHCKHSRLAIKNINKLYSTSFSCNKIIITKQSMFADNYRDVDRVDIPDGDSTLFCYCCCFCSLIPTYRISIEHSTKYSHNITSHAYALIRRTHTPERLFTQIIECEFDMTFKRRGGVHSYLNALFEFSECVSNIIHDRELSPNEQKLIDRNEWKQKSVGTCSTYIRTDINRVNYVCIGESSFKCKRNRQRKRRR